MSTRKAVNKQSWRGTARATPAVDDSATGLSRSYPKLRLPSLEIDANDGMDCDPYNRTGQHCIDALKQASDGRRSIRKPR